MWKEQHLQYTPHPSPVQYFLLQFPRCRDGARHVGYLLMYFIPSLCTMVYLSGRGGDTVAFDRRHGLADFTWLGLDVTSFDLSFPDFLLILVTLLLL